MDQIRFEAPIFDNPFSERRTIRGSRSLGVRDKKSLYVKCHRKCGACGKKIHYDEMQVGHRTAWARGGKTTFNNSVALCWSCNNNMGTQKYESYMKKMSWKIPIYLQKEKKQELKTKKKISRPRQQNLFKYPFQRNNFGFKI